MNETIERLKACPELMKQMGVTWVRDTAWLETNTDDFDVDFDKDDCFGSALFVVRGLKVLGEENYSTLTGGQGGDFSLCVYRNGESSMRSVAVATTMTQAVAKALLAVFGKVPA